MKHFYLTCIAAIVLFSPVVSASPLPLGTSVPELVEGGISGTFGTFETLSTQLPLGDAEDVSALIDAIGEVTFTADCKARIDAAQEAWDQLSFTEKLRLPTPASSACS